MMYYWPPPMAMPPPAPPGGATLHAVGEIARAMGRYRWVIAIQIVLAVTGALITGATVGGLGGLLSSSSLFNNVGNGGNATHPPVPAPPLAGALAAFGVLAGLLSLVVLILTVISWVTWRSGLEELERAGPEWGTAHAQEARDARRWYRWVVASFFLNILVGVGVGIAVIFLILGFATSHAGRNGTIVPVTQASANAFAAEIVLVLLVAVVLGAILNFLLLSAAATSHSRGIYSLSSEPDRERLRSGRQWMMVGAAVSALSGLVLYSPYLALTASVGFALVLIGFERMRAVYVQWAAHPPPISMPPAAPLPGR